MTTKYISNLPYAHILEELLVMTPLKKICSVIGMDLNFQSKGNA